MAATDACTVTSELETPTDPSHSHQDHVSTPSSHTPCPLVSPAHLMITSQNRAIALDLCLLKRCLVRLLQTANRSWHMFLLTGDSPCRSSHTAAKDREGESDDDDNTLLDLTSNSDHEALKSGQMISTDHPLLSRQLTRIFGRTAAIAEKERTNL